MVKHLVTLALTPIGQPAQLESRSGTDRNRAGMLKVHGGASTVLAHARGGGGARLKSSNVSPSETTCEPEKLKSEQTWPSTPRSLRRALAASQLKGQRLIRDCAKTPRCMEVTTHAPGERVEHDA